MANSFLWHDYETFGADPRRDRPAQFAAIRTDEDLEPVGESVVLYCQPSADVLPQPDACLITGITPQQARDKGVPDNEFAAVIAEMMGQAGTCSVGFNNFRFDDEVTRHLFWRNFFDPYAREYANGNSRFDLIDVARMMRALRPEGLEWPDRDDGTPSFRLEALAAANDLDTSRAHDALADVEVTLGLARRMRQTQPRLWNWALKMRDRSAVSTLLAARKPLLHASARLPARTCATAPVLPLAGHPLIRSQWLVWNLQEDPEPFLDLDSDHLADLLWTPAADLPDEYRRLPIKQVRTNRCPMLAPMSVLDDAAAERLDIDRARINAHASMLHKHPELITRLQTLFEQPQGAAPDPELDLYGGFVSGPDIALRNRVRTLSGDELAGLSGSFQDERLNTLLFRYRARLWPEHLDHEEKVAWEDYRRRRLLHDPDLGSIRLDEYEQRLGILMGERPEQRSVLEALACWPDEIGLHRPRDSHSIT